MAGNLSGTERRSREWEDHLILQPQQPNVLDIAAQLASIAANLGELALNQHGDRSSQFAASSPSKSDLKAIAARTYRMRRLRDDLFAVPGLFGEPAWDMLLDLFVAHTNGATVSVSSACIASAAPPTTALRWLGSLQQAGLIGREEDPKDKRRVLVRLTRDGVERMERFLSAVAAATAR